MDKPKLTTVTYIEYNGETFHIGDKVKFKKEHPFYEGEEIGRLIGVKEILEFDCSRTCESKIEKFNICNLASISHAAEQEE